MGKVYGRRVILSRYTVITERQTYHLLNTSSDCHNILKLIVFALSGELHICHLLYILFKGCDWKYVTLL